MSRAMEAILDVLSGGAGGECADDGGYELAGWSQEVRCSAVPAVLMRETFGQFDAGARGVGEESGGKVKPRQDLVRRVEFDSVGGEFLAEAFEVFDLECDVIDSSTGGWRYGIGMRKGKSGAGNEAGIRLILPSRSGAEELRIPSLFVVRPRRVEVNVIELQRRVHSTSTSSTRTPSGPSIMSWSPAG